MNVSEADDRYPWRVLLVSSIGIVLCGLNVSTMDVALPAVANHFDASASQASWIMLSYLMVNASLILALGRVADLLSRRTVYLAGLAIFTVASSLCGFAPDATTLAILRGIQAVGAAALITNVTALLADAFPPSGLSTALGLNVGLVSTAMISGPAVGGALVSAFGWQACFWFNVPIGAVGLVLAWRTLRRSPGPSSGERFDLLGAVLATAAISGLVFALSEGGANGWLRPSVLIGLGVFMLGLPAFLVLERSRKHPLLDLRLFADKDRAVAFISGFLMAVARGGVGLMVSLYLQAVLGLDPFSAGLLVMPMAIGLAVASPVAGWLARRYSSRDLSRVGMLTVMISLAMLALVMSPNLPELALIVGLFGVGAGTGVFMTPNTHSIMAGVQAHQRGIANGVRSGMQHAGLVISVGLGLALSTTWLGDPEKRAAYAGRLSSVSVESGERFTAGIQLSFSVFAAMCLIALISSLWRTPSDAAPAGRRPDDHPTDPTGVL